MSIAVDVKTLVAQNTIGKIDKLVVSDASGEVLRKDPLEVISYSPLKKEWRFFLNETEANTTITRLSLYENATNTEIAFSSVNIPKTNVQSLLIRWTVEVR
ncbi:hypothetical protein KVG29_08880 [Caldicoprobacter algeriensis]|uniref:hypothetical protein n=1 Tax=Caldicoprobacter algeriensis TaxID=699281 RepID=UPI00207A1C60|nr:hypothetical protein [Caldicoprobacter algeriensis]MCM8901333.1 hypothetical protein [Caldicoprobacter algeriensis]